jgi:hypothetical protein
MGPSRKRKIIAIVIVSLLLLLCLSIMRLASGPVLLFEPAAKSNCAAIAIRDDVNRFQKFGTRLFTYPYLDAHYEEVIYLTEYDSCKKKKEFIEGLNKLLSGRQQVDIFLLAHTNYYYDWVREIDPAKRSNIRMVYNTGCYGKVQSDVWRGLGAKSYIAHEGESLSPVFYFYFLRRWCGGATIREAIDEANRNMIEKLNIVPVNAPLLQSSVARCYGADDYSITDEKQ